MANEVVGIALSEFEEPILDALYLYSHLTDERLTFEERAAKLDLTPDKPNSARSATPISFEGEAVSTLYVIAFAPEDATGDDKTFSIGEVDSGVFPAEPKYLPRSKAGIDTEAHVTIASKQMESSSDPTLFAGSLSVLGVQGGRIETIGHVGQTDHDFRAGMRSIRAPRPTVTLTTGYRNGLFVPVGAPDQERFGDPHAILNRHPSAVQVCGFIALGAENAARHRRIFSMLGAVEPRTVPQL